MAIFWGERLIFQHLPFLGHGSLSSGGFTIKALCQDSLSARQTLQRLRVILYGAMKRQVPSLGRYM